MNWIDVSAPLSAATAVWPGDTAYRFEPAARIAADEICNVSAITMTSHFGTHVDAPWHFEDGGKRLDQVDTALFFGDARVIDVGARSAIAAADLGDAKLPARILLKTRNSQRSLDAPFIEDYVALAEDAAARMVDEGVRLVGIDYLSVAPLADPAPVHHILLRAEVLIVEGLRLAGIAAGTYPFVVLPLALKDADGAPARAFIGMR